LLTTHSNGKSEIFSFRLCSCMYNFNRWIQKLSHNGYLRWGFLICDTNLFYVVEQLSGFKLSQNFSKQMYYNCTSFLSVFTLQGPLNAPIIYDIYVCIGLEISPKMIENFLYSKNMFKFIDIFFFNVDLKRFNSTYTIIVSPLYIPI